MHQHFERQKSGGEYRNNYRNIGYSRSRDRKRNMIILQRTILPVGRKEN